MQNSLRDSLTMAQFHLQKLKPAEADALLAFAAELWPRVYSFMISPEQIDYMLKMMYAPEVTLAQIKSGTDYFWIQSDDQKAGFVSFGPIDSDGSCELHKLYVDPDFQREGLARQTLGEIRAIATAAGAQNFRLRVNRTNTPALAFYEAMGFTKEGQDCADIGGGFVMDDYLLRLEW